MKTMTEIPKIDCPEFHVSREKTISGTSILTVEIVRNCEKGLIVRLQSPIDWTILKNNDHDKSFILGGVKCYYPAQEYLESVPGIFYYAEENCWQKDEYPNLAMFLAKDLKDGVEFNFGLFPVSDTILKDFFRKIRDQAKILYLTYAKPLDLKMTFTASIVEKEDFEVNK